MSALLIGRFIVLVRTLLLTIAGLFGLNNAHFQLFDWMSGLFWVLILTSLGYPLGKTSVFPRYEDQLMSCLMLLPVVLLVFGLAGSLVVLQEKEYGNRGQIMLKSCITLRRLAWSTTFVLFIDALLLTQSVTCQQGSTFAIRAVSQGASMLDSFSIWHHLDANGIRFKGITPQNDILLITFDFSAQSAAAKVVLGQILPYGFVVTQQGDNNQAAQWLSRLRETPHHSG